MPSCGYGTRLPWVLVKIFPLQLSLDGFQCLLSVPLLRFASLPTSALSLTVKRISSASLLFVATDLLDKTLLYKALGLIKVDFCFGLTNKSKLFFPLLKPKEIFVFKTACSRNTNERLDLCDFWTCFCHKKALGLIQSSLLTWWVILFGTAITFLAEAELQVGFFNIVF